MHILKMIIFSFVFFCSHTIQLIGKCVPKDSKAQSCIALSKNQQLCPFLNSYFANKDNPQRAKPILQKIGTLIKREPAITYDENKKLEQEELNCLKRSAPCKCPKPVKKGAPLKVSAVRKPATLTPSLGAKVAVNPPAASVKKTK